jgi:predicted dehydrogenase
VTRLKYALIGCGRRGEHHAETVEMLQDIYDVVAVCDADVEAAERIADSLGVRAYSDIRAMVEHEQLDLCDVAVPSELHHVVSSYLSRCGIPQIVETPLAPTPGLMDLMVETAALGGVKLQTAENFPFLPVEQFVRQVITSGVVGPVHRCFRLFSSTWYHGMAAIRARLGATPISVSSIGHSMPVVSYVDSAKRDWRREDLEFHAVDFDNGSLAIAMVGNKNGCLGRNRLVGFEVCGERGTIITNGNQTASGGETVNVCTDEDISERFAKATTFPFERTYTSEGILSSIKVDLPHTLGGAVVWENPYKHQRISEMHISLAYLLDAMARAIREDGVPAWSGEDGRLDMEMMLGAQRSIAVNRQPVALPLGRDAQEEGAFDVQFEERFGVHPREDLDRALAVSYKAR